MHSVIALHWYKFKHWIQNIILHEDTDYLKLSTKFTTTCQHISEDLNQFYLCLFNLEIQSERTINIEDFRMHLIMLLQNLITQHYCTYTTVQNTVAQAGRL
jgi:hypothetical protein